MFYVNKASHIRFSVHARDAVLADYPTKQCTSILAKAPLCTCTSTIPGLRGTSFHLCVVISVGGGILDWLNIHILYVVALAQPRL